MHYFPSSSTPAAAAPAGWCTLPWSLLHANPICGPAVFGSINYIPLLSYQLLASSLPLLALVTRKRVSFPFPSSFHSPSSSGLTKETRWNPAHRPKQISSSATWYFATQKEETLAEGWEFLLCVDHRLGQKGTWHRWFCLMVSNVSSH